MRVPLSFSPRVACRRGLVVLVLALLPSCVHSEVDRRFRNEYHCRDFRREDLGGRAYRMTGCGHRITYVCAGGSNEMPIVCMRQGDGETVRPPARAQERRIEVHARSTNGLRTLRLDLHGAGLHLEYTPQRDPERVVVVPEGPACRDLVILTSSGRYGDAHGIPLIELVGIPNDERIELVACQWRALLNPTELRRLRLFTRHALEMRREVSP
ncbi:MAG: hypothetical protein KC619_13560 [Myxococcales bacterium]|nr:hypothetical protein [Myxococcales bacterium]